MCSRVRFLFPFAVLLVAGLPFAAIAAPGDPVSVSLSPDGLHEMTLSLPGDGVVEITTTGTDPFLYTEPLPEGTTLIDTPILAFEYFSLTGTDEIQVFAVPPQREEVSVHGPGLGRSEGWSSHRIDLTSIREKLRDPLARLRIDFGRHPGRTAQLRNIVLRGLNDDERRLAARLTEAKAHEAAADAALADYLYSDMHSAITWVSAEATTIHIQGVTDLSDGDNEGGQRWLVEMPVEADYGDAASLEKVAPITVPWGETFAMRVPRFAVDGRDRLYSRWAILLEAEDNGRAIALRPDGVAFRALVSRAYGKLPRWSAGISADTDASAPGRASFMNVGVKMPRSDDQEPRYDLDAIALKDKQPFVSFGRYADSVAARPGLTEAKPRNRKGLGGFSPGRPVEDIPDLCVSAVTVNIVLDSFMRTTPGAGRTAYDYGGRTWYTEDSGVAHLDHTMQTAAAHDLVVSAIILLNQAKGAAEGEFRRIVAHPDADPAGIFVMPNFTTAEGVNAYAAALNFLAERYSRPDGAFGRIHHWIMHNEVNSGWVWTNMGEKSALRYMDAYHKSMRMAQLIAWQYDPFARVYISLEHHWDSVYADHCYKGRELLELLLDFSRAEGDFPWGIAHHPYPENLRDPRAWEDETAWFSYDTPRITFKNIEVIHAWVKERAHWFAGETMRDLQFTEQGPNSPDYTEASLRDQAACMAYLWKKLEALDSVSMFHFHNWVDNRHEGGLRIGLRRFPDDAEDPHGKKPVWHVFQALETERQAETIEFAKEVIGIQDWSEVVYAGEISEARGE